MAVQNRGHGSTGNLGNIEQFRSIMQEIIDNKKSIEEQRRFGQFATPYELAKEIVSFGLSILDTDEITFLEPCIKKRCVLFRPFKCSKWRLYF